MDVRLFAQAVGRHKLIAVVGVLLTVALALLAYVSVNPFRDPVVRYRAEQTWVSRMILQINESGFTEGKADNPGRQAELAQLAPLYATLADSDAVKQRVRAQGFRALGNDVQTEAVVDSGRASLPLVRISAFSPSAERAVEHVRRQAQAFIDYMATRQEAAGIPKRSRVLLSVVQGASDPRVIEPRKKTLAIVVALAMLILTAALILVVDNARRRRVGTEALPLQPEAPAAQADLPTPIVKAPAARGAVAATPPSTGAVAPHSRKQRAEPKVEPTPRPARVATDTSAEHFGERIVEVGPTQPTSIAPWRTPVDEDTGGHRLRRANTNEE